MEKLTGRLRTYPWGSRTLAPQLRGEAPANTPEAEWWFGAHPADPAIITATGQGLDEAIAADPIAALGPRVAEEFDGRLPFLVKLLAAAEPLSLQAHPSKAQALLGFERENAAGIELSASNRNYRDDNHKPELLVALTDFRAMAGFRPLNSTLELMKQLAIPELDRYLTIIDPKRHDDADGVRGLFTTWIALPSRVRHGLIAAIVHRCHEIIDEGSAPEWMGEVMRTVIELNERYPGDIGVLGALLLNHVRLAPGQALFLAAGELHTYVSGMGVEVMANSDNVLRGGLTSKYVDVSELIKVLNFAPVDNPVVTQSGSRYPVPVKEFTVDRFASSDGERRIKADAPVVVLCTSGAITSGGATLTAGEAGWIPAASEPVSIRPKGDTAEYFVVSC